MVPELEFVVASHTSKVVAIGEADHPSSSTNKGFVPEYRPLDLQHSCRTNKIGTPGDTVYKGSVGILKHFRIGKVVVVEHVAKIDQPRLVIALPFLIQPDILRVVQLLHTDSGSDRVAVVVIDDKVGELNIVQA